MSIGVFSPAPPPLTGQSAYHAYLRALLLPEGGYFFRIGARRPGGGPASYTRKLVDVLGLLWDVFARPRFRCYIVVLDAGLGLALNMLMVIAARLRGGRIFLSHHSFAYIDRENALMRLLQWASGSDRCNLYLCDEMRRRFEERYGRSAHFVLSNARRVQMEDPGGEHAASEHLILGYISNVSFEKGIREFVRLVERANADGVSIRGVIAGPTFERNVEVFLRESVEASQGSLEWIGPVYGAEKRAFFSRISLLAFPTSYANEAQPNVIFEALASGVPVLSIARGCIAEDLAEAGCYVAPNAQTFVQGALDYLRPLSLESGRERLIELSSQARRHFEALVAQARAAETMLIEELRG